MSRLLGYSRSTLERKAAKRGITVEQYLDNCRAAKARQKEARRERAKQREAAKHKRRTEKG